MNQSASQQKSFRRSQTGRYELSEREINDFLANSDDNVDGEGSDWDELDETDIDALLTPHNPQPSTSVQNPNQDKLSTSSDTQQTTYSSRGALQDVGVDVLFTDQSAKPDSPIDSRQLFGSPNPSDDDDDFTDLSPGHEDADREDSVAFSEYGRAVQSSLSKAKRLAKERHIEREVDRLIDSPASTTPSTSSSSSVSLALAACADRRKATLEQLNRASLPSSNYDKPPSSSSSKPSALTPISSSSTSHSQQLADGSGYWVAKPTRLRVCRPQLSSEMWDKRTANRHVMGLVQFASHCRSNRHLASASRSKADLDLGDVVLVGVIGTKSGVKQSRNQRLYSSWVLSDLELMGPGCSGGCVKVMLFGSCHEQLWKEVEGSVVAILGPRLMSNSSSSIGDKELSVTLESPAHVMCLGRSLDFAVCEGTTSGGQSCFRVVNKSLSRYCETHARAAYSKASRSRPGFFISQISGPPGQRKRLRGINSFVSSDPRRSFEPTRSDLHRRPTPNINLNVSKLASAGFQLDNSIGIRLDPTAVNPSQQPSSKATTSLSDPESKLIQVLRRPSAGSLNLLHQIARSEAVATSNPSNGDQKPSTNKRTKLASHNRPHSSRPVPAATNENSGKQTQSPSMTFSSFFSAMSSSQSDTNPGFIDLGPLPPPSRKPTSTDSLSATAVRQRSIALVKSRGGVDAMQASQASERLTSSVNSAVLKQKQTTSQSPLAQVLGPIKSNKKKATNTAADQQRSTDWQKEEDQENVTPPSQQKEAARQLLAKQIAQGSAHVPLADAMERQAEMAKLNAIAQRDTIEQRLVEQTEESCTFVKCKTCNYRAWKVAPDCRRLEHEVVRVKGVKRFFRCRRCERRTVTFERYPKVACSNCGESLFEKTGIIPERKAAKRLPGGQLLTRGREQKFIG